MAAEIARLRREVADLRSSTLARQGTPGDHGALTGLGDNDHPQYARKATAETISAAWEFTAGLRTPLTTFVAADLASNYPLGLSYAIGGTADGWPTNGITFTIKPLAGRTVQFSLTHRTGVGAYIRSENTDGTWTAWSQVAFV